MWGISGQLGPNWTIDITYPTSFRSVVCSAFSCWADAHDVDDNPIIHTCGIASAKMYSTSRGANDGFRTRAWYLLLGY